MCLCRFSSLCVLSVSLDHLIPVLLAFVVLGLVSTVPSQEIGWEECLGNHKCCVKLDVKPLISQHYKACDLIRGAGC